MIASPTPVASHPCAPRPLSAQVTPAADDHTAPTDTTPTPGTADHGHAHWLDLALAVWLDDAGTQGAPSQTASDH